MTPADSQQRAHVDQQVHGLFQRSAAFQALPPAERAKIERDTAEIVQVMAANKAMQAAKTPSADPYALPLEGPRPNVSGGQKTAPTFTGGVQPGSAGSAFGPKEQGDFGTALATGVGQAGELLRQVNFPAFVAELIQGVFQAVVDASIQQMKQYGELVQGVVMSLNDFRDANVSENQGRDHLVSKFPNLMQINITDEGPRVGLRPSADTDELPDIAGSLGLDEEITDLDEETIEEKLVPAARNDLARSRQTLLATMLLMGINRIVVTDGKINARLRYSFRARDSMVKHAQDFDYENMGQTTAWQGSHDSGRDSEWKKDSGYTSNRWSKGEWQYSSTPAVYLTSFEDTTTQAELEAQAKMSGDVSLSFKSETVDLNKLVGEADIFKLERVRSAGRAAPGAPAGSPQAAGTPVDTPAAGGGAPGATA